MSVNIEHLVFSSGTYKGLVYIGIIEKLIKEKVLDLNKIKSIYGCSVGSVVGFILALKIKLEFIKEYITKFPAEVLFKFKASQVMELYKKKGIYDVDVFYKFLSGFFKYCGIKKTITLKEFYNLTKIDFYIYSFNINTCKLVEFSYHTHPDLKVIEAIYMSSTIPFIFRPMYYDSNYYLDGTMGNDFPISNCLKRVEDHKTIFGISCDTSKTIQNEISDKDNVVTLIQALFNWVMDLANFKKTHDSGYNLINIDLPFLSKSIVKNLISNKSNERQQFLDIGEKMALEFISSLAL